MGQQNPYSTTRPDKIVLDLLGTQAKVIAALKATQASSVKVLTSKIKGLQTTNDGLKTQLLTQGGILAFNETQINVLKKSKGYSPYGTATITAADANTIAKYRSAYNTAQASWNTINNSMRANSQIISALQLEVDAINKIGQSAIANQKLTVPTLNTASDSITSETYKYNAPMVKSAYMSLTGPQAMSATDGKFIADPGNLEGVTKHWEGVVPQKGVIQMSKMFASAANPPSITAGQIKTTNPYGFKFLYNPTDVSMAWGIVDSFSPEYITSGQNATTGVAIGLMKSVISFSLLLNRVDDLNHFGKDGILLTEDPYPNPTPDNAERKVIWKRGTMYDLEYLFRSMGGPYADYKSGLNGTTADRGWLQPIPVELHLGTGLHYLVRVSSLDVKHIMFNERMVPILSTVNINCTRYYDSPGAYDMTYYSPESTVDTTTAAAKIPTIGTP